MQPSYANLWYAIGLFALLLVLFHLYVFVERPGKRFLKKLDYLWLGFSALSLVSAAAGQRQLMATGELERSRHLADNALLDLQRYAASARHYTCDTDWIAPIVPVPEAIGRYQSRRAACAWFTARDSAAEKPGIDLASAITAVDSPWPSDLSRSWTYSPLEMSLAYAKKSLAAFNQDEANAGKGEAEEGLVFLLPYLLAIALALRVSKVTGELRLES